MPANLTSVGLSFSESQTARRGLALWIWSVLVISDAVFLTRRSTGSFSSAAPESLAVFSTAIVACLSWLAWLLHLQSHFPGTSKTGGRVFSLGISLAITLAWVAAVSANASSLTQGLLTGVLLVQLMSAVSIGFGTELVFDVVSHCAGTNIAFADNTSNRTSSALPNARTPESERIASMPEVASFIRLEPIDSFEAQDEEAGEEGEEFNTDVDEGQTLWLSRRIDGELELVEGWVRVTFAAGQRETVVHVSFCPPLGATPEIETEDLDGCGLELRVAAAFPFGARLSVRRTDSVQEEQSHRVGFAAEAQAASRAA